MGLCYKKINDNPKKLLSLYLMEATGGDPDAISFANRSYVFVDCSLQKSNCKKECML